MAARRGLDTDGIAHRYCAVCRSSSFEGAAAEVLEYILGTECAIQYCGSKFYGSRRNGKEKLKEILRCVNCKGDMKINVYFCYLPVS